MFEFDLELSSVCVIPVFDRALEVEVVVANEIPLHEAVKMEKLQRLERLKQNNWLHKATDRKRAVAKAKKLAAAKKAHLHKEMHLPSRLQKPGYDGAKVVSAYRRRLSVEDSSRLKRIARRLERYEIKRFDRYLLCVFSEGAPRPVVSSKNADTSMDWTKYIGRHVRVSPPNAEGKILLAVAG